MAEIQHSKKNASFPGLLDLPQSTIVHIAELLPCKDLPSFACTCRELAGMAAFFYGERRVLDMRCFNKISPMLCAQIVDRFSSSHLIKCFFKCDLSFHSVCSPSILQAIIERFLDNYCCNEEILRDLHSTFAPENAEWFTGEPTLRPIDVLAHCFLLESMLSSQPTLQELVLDVEFGVFRVPKSKGYRQHWYLLQPFLALQTIQRKCLSLERYVCAKALYQSSAVDMKHVQLRFLQNSTQLKFLNMRFGLDKSSLESYEHIKGPLLLEKAVFLLPKWCGRPEDCVCNCEKLRVFAQKMPNLESVAMAFNSRGALKYATEFLHNLPGMRSLLLKCEFNAGYPSFDIDEGAHLGGFFGGFESLLSSKVTKLSMLDVPEGEFDMYFGSNSAKLPTSLEQLHVCIAMSSAELGQKEQSMIDEFFKRSPYLRSFRIECNSSGNQETLVFSKTLSRRMSSADFI